MLPPTSFPPPKLLPRPPIGRRASPRARLNKKLANPTSPVRFAATHGRSPPRPIHTPPAPPRFFTVRQTWVHQGRDDGAGWLAGDARGLNVLCAGAQPHPTNEHFTARRGEFRKGRPRWCCRPMEDREREREIINRSGNAPYCGAPLQPAVASQVATAPPASAPIPASKSYCSPTITAGGKHASKTSLLVVQRQAVVLFTVLYSAPGSTVFNTYYLLLRIPALISYGWCSKSFGHQTDCYGCAAFRRTAVVQKQYSV